MGNVEGRKFGVICDADGLGASWSGAKWLPESPLTPVLQLAIGRGWHAGADAISGCADAISRCADAIGGCAYVIDSSADVIDASADVSDAASVDAHDAAGKMSSFSRIGVAVDHGVGVEFELEGVGAFAAVHLLQDVQMQVGEGLARDGPFALLVVVRR